MVGDPVTYFCSEILDNYRQFCGDLGIYRQNVYKLSNDNKRNILYAKGIDEIEPTQSAVVLLGAAHFYTEKGVLALLRKHDWTITRFSCPVWSDDSRAQKVANGLLKELQKSCKKVKPMRAHEKASKQGLKQEDGKTSIEQFREDKTDEPEPKSKVVMERLARSQGLKQEDAATRSSGTATIKHKEDEKTPESEQETTERFLRSKRVKESTTKPQNIASAGVSEEPSAEPFASNYDPKPRKPRRSKNKIIRKALNAVTSEELDAANIKHLVKYAHKHDISLPAEWPTYHGKPARYKKAVAEELKIVVRSHRAR